MGDGFIKLIKMLLAPVIFLTVVSGIASMENMKELGRVGARALLYFEVLSTLALGIGLIVVDVLKPGDTSADIVSMPREPHQVSQAQADCSPEKQSAKRR